MADDPFGGTEGLAPGGHRVHLGGVDDVDAARQRVVEDGMSVGFADLLAEGHGAEADGGDAQVTAAERAQGKG